MTKKLLSYATEFSVACLRALAFCSTLSLFSISIHAQEKLVKDLNRNEFPFYNEYSNLVNANGTLYFISQNKELWKSTGTSTVRLKTNKSMSSLIWTGSMLYFVGEDGAGKELWKSDGTSAGTIRVKDIRPGSLGSNPNGLIALNGEVYFSANNGVHGNELWRSNGTAAGTLLVKDIYAGSLGSDPAYLVDGHGVLMFSANDGITGRDLWKSNGTAAGTVKVLEGASRDTNSDPQLLTKGPNGFVYFTAWQSTTGRELWKTNGTATGTMRVKDIRQGNIDAGITTIVANGAEIYFNANNVSEGHDIWKTNGTSAGTVKVIELDPENDWGFLMEMKAFFGNLYFASLRNDRYYFYRSNGTQAGTVQLVTSNIYYNTNFTYSNGYVFFFTTNFDHQTWYTDLLLHRIKLDGSNKAKVYEFEIPESFGDFYYDFVPQMTAFNNGLVFPGIHKPNEGFKLLFTTYQVGSTSVLFDTYKPTMPSYPRAFVKTNNYVFFLTEANGYNSSLWRTDGTAAGTILLKKFDHYVTEIVGAGNHAFVIEPITNNGTWQIWKSDGTVSGTAMLKEFENRPGEVDYSTMVSTGNGIVYFYSPGAQLFKTDGTTAGTILLKSFHYIDQVAPSGNGAFLIVRTADGAQEIWKTNGTTAGTVKIKSIHSGGGQFVQDHFWYASNEHVYYFIADDGIHGYELWKTDGTSAGTHMVKDIAQDDETRDYPDIGLMELLGDKLYFSARFANSDGAPWDLYVTDGTDAGTEIVASNKNVTTLMPIQDKMVFVHREMYYGEVNELWAADGTPGGTIKLADVDPGSYYTYHTYLGNFVYFANGSNDFWRTDGTICATSEFDLGVTQVGPIANIGTKLLFGAHSNFYGTELYSFEAGGLPEDPCGTAASARISTAPDMIFNDDEKIITSTPNPFKNSFSIQVNNGEGLPAQVEVYSMTGVTVDRMEISTNQPHIMGERWNTGMYILKVRVADKLSIDKVLKE